MPKHFFIFVCMQNLINMMAINEILGVLRHNKQKLVIVSLSPSLSVYS